MLKKIVIIIEGSNSAINELLTNFFQTLPVSSKFKCTLNVIKGLNNYKIKSANTIIVIPTFEEKSLIQKIKEIKSIHNQMKILLFTNFLQADFICTLFDIGIHAHISTHDNITELTHALESILANQTYNSVYTDKIISNYYTHSRAKREPLSKQPLTRTEKVVLKHLCIGLSSPEIAELLFKSIKTIDTHRRHIYQKMGVHNISDLLIMIHKRSINLDD